jgi:hypothetical protein
MPLIKITNLRMHFSKNSINGAYRTLLKHIKRLPSMNDQSKQLYQVFRKEVFSYNFVIDSSY